MRITVSILLVASVALTLPLSANASIPEPSKAFGIWAIPSGKEMEWWALFWQAVTGITAALSIAGVAIGLVFTLRQLRSSNRAEMNKATLDLIVEARLPEYTMSLRTVTATGDLDADKRSAEAKFEPWFKHDSPNIDESFINAFFAIANFYDKVEEYIRAKLVDKDLFIRSEAYNIVCFYYVFQSAYFENPQHPQKWVAVTSVAQLALAYLKRPNVLASQSLGGKSLIERATF